MRETTFHITLAAGSDDDVSVRSDYIVSLDDEFSAGIEPFTYIQSSIFDKIDLTGLFTSSDDTSKCWHVALESITPAPSEGAIFKVDNKFKTLNIYSFSMESAGTYEIELLAIDNFLGTEKSFTTLQINLEAESDENDLEAESDKEDSVCASYDVSLADEFSDEAQSFTYSVSGIDELIAMTGMFTSSPGTETCWKYALGSITPEPSEDTLFDIN